MFPAHADEDSFDKRLSLLNNFSVTCKMEFLYAQT
jgi:hypothetical protein